MDNMEELLLLMHNANGIYRVTSDTDFETTQTLVKALSDLYVTVTLKDGLMIYRLTNKGAAAAAQYLKEQESDLHKSSEQADTESDDYPAFFQNRANGCVVLAINPTCGTVVRQAKGQSVLEYPLPLGTFQTCFIPFFVSEEWKCIPTDTFVVKLPKGAHK